MSGLGLPADNQLRNLRRLSRGIGRIHERSRAASANEAARRISTFAINTSQNRRFISLGRGNYGLAPNTIQPGDVCAILYGTSWPFILRKVAGRQSHYKFVGPAYILSRQTDEYGFPDRLGYDEKCEDWRDWNLPNQDIVLC
ncbi:hypothetical protein F4801DRAFT_102313 [Xylaria longipes]|nr:hypothetical protein F4801DRAFT_102313 [Xylaria longipes]